MNDEVRIVALPDWPTPAGAPYILIRVPDDLPRRLRELYDENTGATRAMVATIATLLGLPDVVAS